MGNEKKRKEKNTKKTKETQGWSEALFNRSHNVVPVAIRETLKWIESNALKIEGLFRVTGSFTAVEHLKSEFLQESAFVDLDRIGCKYSIAALVVHFLDDLDDCLLTCDLYYVFISIKEVQDKETKMECIRQALGLLPVGCRAVLSCLLPFFYKVQEFQEQNKMGASNLAIVFAPIFLRTPLTETDLFAIEKQCQAAQSLIELMIMEHEQILGKQASMSLPEEIEGDFKNLYIKALENYSASEFSTSEKVERPRKASIVALPQSNQKKLLDQHQRIRNQTISHHDVMQRDDADVMGGGGGRGGGRGGWRVRW